MTELLPHDLDAERAVLGALLAGASLADVLPLAAASFFRPAHQVIYEVIEALADADPVTVADELRHRGDLRRVGGGPYLHTLMAVVPVVASAGHYAAIVRELAERRALIQQLERARQAAFSPAEDLDSVRALARIDDAAIPGECGQLLRVTPVSEIKIKATEWLWHHRIPIGALTLLPGREGTGKSMAGAWLAAQVTRGLLPGVYEGIPKGVFYAAREDDWERTIAPRLVVAGADTSRVYRIDVERQGSTVELVLPQHCDLLRDAIRKHDVALLFLDPLMSTISGALDTHKDREARTALEPLAAIAMDTDSSIVGLAHFSKALTADALNLVMASKAFTAVPRAVLGMARDDQADEDNAVVLTQIKSNLGPLSVPSLKFTFQEVTIDTEDGRGAHVGRLVEAGETERSVHDILAGRGDEADQDKWNAATWWLYDHLANDGGEALASAAIKAGNAAGHSKDSVKRASQKLAIIKHKDGFQGPWLWTFDPQRSKQPEGSRPKSAKSANESETANPLLPSRPLTRRSKRQDSA